MHAGTEKCDKLLHAALNQGAGAADPAHELVQQTGVPKTTGP